MGGHCARRATWHREANRPLRGGSAACPAASPAHCAAGACSRGIATSQLEAASWQESCNALWRRAMGALRFIATFVAVTLVVTVAVVTGAFMFWSVISVQPGTLSALFTLFILAPGAGIAAGLYAAAKSIRRPTTSSESGGGSTGLTLLRATPAALVGFLAGFGGMRAGLDLAFTQRFENPASAPAWLPFAPTASGIVVAMAFVLLTQRLNRHASGSNRGSVSRLQNRDHV